jgi:hypothetical protein
MKEPVDPKLLGVMIQIVRMSVAIQLVGGSALEVSFEGRDPNGLSRKLEVVLARIMEGLTGPERGIFNASQFVLIQKDDAMRESDRLLDEAIARAGLQNNTEQVRRQLQALYDTNANSRRRFIEPTAGRPARTVEPLLSPQESAKQVASIEQSISADPLVVSELKRYFESYQQAILEYQALKDRLSTQGSNYVGLFDSAENMLVIGRPQDPTQGQSSARKLAMVVIFLGIIAGGGLVWLVEIFYTGLRTRDEFELLTGLPVVARLQRLPR